jgi:hypothetical protein
MVATARNQLCRNCWSAATLKAYVWPPTERDGSLVEADRHGVAQPTTIGAPHRPWPRAPMVAVDTVVTVKRFFLIGLSFFGLPLA